MNVSLRRAIILGTCFFCIGISILSAQEALPPPPANYFNDEAYLVSPAVAGQLNEELRNFDQKTSTQIVVFIGSELNTKTSLDDYAQRLYTAWHPGTKKESNGALLLIFPKEHQIRIQTGYGLEGALPDALCKRIIDDVITPEFQKGNYNQGVIAGVTAMMKATAGEYKASTSLKKKTHFSWMRLLFSPLGFFLLMIIGSSLMNWRNRARGVGSTSPGWFIGGGGFGGGFGGGDGGGFSGGGGDSGGGGASGGW